MKKFVVIIVFIAAACSTGRKDKANSDTFEAGVKLKEVSNKKIKEASGLVASVRNPGLLWTLNDSGNGAEIFLLDDSLNIRVECHLAGIENRDWEDIAIGPGPDSLKTYLYVGDIGDNLARYDFKYIYRFEEPLVSDSLHSITIRDIDKITVELDEKKDAEALMIDPQTKDIFIVSKREDPVTVYKFSYPYEPGDTIHANSQFTIPLTYIVAGDISKDGTEVLMKSINNVYYWKANENETIEDLLRRAPFVLPYKKEPQGESIAFSNNADGYFTISEKVVGEKSFLIFYKRSSTSFAAQ